MWKIGQTAIGEELQAAAFNGDMSQGIEPAARYKRVRSAKSGAVRIAQGAGGRNHWFMRLEGGVSKLAMDVLRHLITSLLLDHRQPGYTAIQDAHGIKSPSGVDAVFTDLERGGYIERPCINGDSGPRFVRILLHPDRRPFRLEAM